MRIVLVDTSDTGHHKYYLSRLLKELRTEGHFAKPLIPGMSGEGGWNARVFPSKRNLVQYLIDRAKWLTEITNHALDFEPDIVHILSSDGIYQLGGAGLGRLRESSTRLIVTQHHTPEGRIRRFLFRSMAKSAASIVVHNDHICEALVMAGIEVGKISVIDYPVFHFSKAERSCLTENSSFMKDSPVLLCLGGTRADKGLDILLESLKLVHEPFHLVVAGKEEHFSLDFIEQKVSTYSSSVTLRLAFLSDDEFGQYVDTSDCIVLPYRKSFDGASGPMTEAIWRRKPVIGPNHGSIGYMIKKYGLGYTFEAENVADLANTITKYLRNPDGFRWSEQAETYRERLNPDAFAKKYIELYERLLNTKRGAE